MEDYNLTWKLHREEAFKAFVDLRERSAFMDVLIFCEDEVIKAHRIILAACSSYFERVLNAISNSADPAARQHTAVIALTKVDPFLLRLALNFMYSGKVTVPADKLEPFMALAELLEVRGLKATPDEPKPFGGQHHGTPQKMRPLPGHAPGHPPGPGPMPPRMRRPPPGGFGPGGPSPGFKRPPLPMGGHHPGMPPKMHRPGPPGFVRGPSPAASPNYEHQHAVPPMRMGGGFVPARGGQSPQMGTQQQMKQEMGPGPSSQHQGQGGSASGVPSAPPSSAQQHQQNMIQIKKEAMEEEEEHEEDEGAGEEEEEEGVDTSGNQFGADNGYEGEGYEDGEEGDVPKNIPDSINPESGLKRTGILSWRGYTFASLPMHFCEECGYSATRSSDVIRHEKRHLRDQNATKN